MRRFRAILLTLLALTQPLLSLAALACGDRCDSVRQPDACCCCVDTEQSSARTSDDSVCGRECSQTPQRTGACASLVGQTMTAAAKTPSVKPVASTPTLPAWTALVALDMTACDRPTGVVASLRPPARAALCIWTT